MDGEENVSAFNKRYLIQLALSFEYEAQHFGFHPRTFLDLVYNIFFECVSTSCMDLQAYLTEEYKEEIPPSIIRTQSDKLFRKLVKQCKKCVDKLEVFLGKNIFHVEPNIVFPEDQVHITNPCTKESDEQLDGEIEEIKQSILKEKAKKFNLKKKIREQKEVLEKLRPLEGELNYWLQNFHIENVTQEEVEIFYAHLKKLLQVNSHPLVTSISTI